MTEATRRAIEQVASEYVTADSFQVKLTASGFVVVDPHGREIHGPYHQRFIARRAADRLNAGEPAILSAL